MSEEQSPEPGPKGPSKIFAAGLLDGQVVLISGAGSGIGRVAAFELAGLGATVIGCGRRIEPLQEAATLAVEAGGHFEALACESATSTQSPRWSPGFASATVASTRSSTMPAASS